jgi:dTDP-4-dehydrorhamnose 3,5-epimerase
MKFIETPLKDAYIIQPEKYLDERGFFARTYCQKEFRDHGITATFVQSNISYNSKKGTLRGMHYQERPYAESKIVSCYAGRIYDVIIDLRPGSPTYCRWFGHELSEQNHISLFIPIGFAHGFQTLKDASLVHYQMGEFYMSEYARGVRWNDPVFNISWPLEEVIISDRDQRYPDFHK